jgi:hypothetical protein
MMLGVPQLARLGPSVDVTTVESLSALLNPHHDITVYMNYIHYYYSRALIS